MITLQFKYWKDKEHYLGYLLEYPDYITQGETLSDLKEHLKDLFSDFTSGEIPNIRKIDELEVAWKDWISFGQLKKRVVY